MIHEGLRSRARVLARITHLVSCVKLRAFRLVSRSRARDTFHLAGRLSMYRDSWRTGGRTFGGGGGGGGGGRGGAGGDGLVPFKWFQRTG